MSKVHILVTGSTGQLGRAFHAISDRHPAYHWHFISRNDLDLSAPSSVKSFLDEKPIDIILHCAAYTAVDRAEQEAALAHMVNCESVREIAQWGGEKNILVIYFSSDYVYHNSVRRPLKESDPCLPKSVYAKSKRCGELAVIAHCPRYFIIRTSWMYSHTGQNFLHTMLRKARDPLRVVDDQAGAPTYAPDLASAVMTMLGALKDETSASQNDLYGIYNFANLGHTTWFGFAKAIFKKQGIQVDLKPISTAEFSAPAPRPPYSVLDTTKIRKTFSLEIPDWENALDRCLNAIK